MKISEITSNNRDGKEKQEINNNMLEYLFVLWSYNFAAVCIYWNFSVKEHFYHKLERST
jgi:hypothetical protein